MKPFLAALALSLSATPAIAGQAQQQQRSPTPPSPSVIAGKIADSMQPAIGQEFDGGIKLTGVAAQGGTLVLTVSGPDGWRAAMSPAQVSSALVQGFCSSAPTFFTETGITMRVDSVDKGAPLSGPVVSACPPAAAK